MPKQEELEQKQEVGQTAAQEDNHSKLPSNLAAGVVVAYGTFPLEGLKKHIQQLKEPVNLYKLTDLKYMQKTFEGFQFYRGSSIFAANIVPATAIQLTVDDMVKQYAQPNTMTYNGLALLPGVLGSFTGVVVENCVARQQVMKCGPSEAMADMFAQGYLRPWKSLPLIATRDGIFTACMFSANDELAGLAEDHFGIYASYAVRLMVSALGAGLSHPFDTLATQMQRTHESISYYEAASKFVAEHGVSGLYKGFGPRFGLFLTFSNLIPVIKNQADDILANRVAPSFAFFKDKPLLKDAMPIDEQRQVYFMGNSI